MANAKYTKPASQEDLEYRQKNGHTSRQLVDGEDPRKSTNGYVGADAIYQNAANKTEKPIHTGDGAEEKLFAEQTEKSSAKEDKEESSTSSMPPSSSTPTSGSGSSS